MAARNDLNLEQKVNLIKDSEQGMSYRVLKDKFHISVGSISNILKRKNEYLDDYECNQSKKMKRKSTNNFTQQLGEKTYEWFALQRSKRIPISGPLLQEYALKVAAELGDTSGFKASNSWLERFKSRYNIQFRTISGEAASVNTDTVEDWISRLPVILENYDP
ncbi:unnamed protein product [Adineta steineri]|uniref:HTH CENPB-type domain-containing protein n=1 Tax=Adineta steineri TaxID=433720 RepID=A0A814TQ65_9BILA|nr:unnamed protein product [Adineta steineri]